MPVAIVDGNLLDASDQYIAHQCNCVSDSAAGLADDLFRRFPHADIYSRRTAPDTPGTIMVRGDEGTTQRPVIAIFGQMYPGKPRSSSTTDSPAAREGYFARALGEIAGLPGLRSIAFPWAIGCGLAGGDWSRYRRLIDRFADDNPRVDVAIYRLQKS